MEVSKINFSAPVTFKKEQSVKENKKHSSNPQEISSNSKTLALSLIGLGALGAAFVIGRKTGKVKEIVKEIKTEAQTVADDAAAQIKNNSAKADDAAAKIKNNAAKADDAVETVFKDAEEFYPSGARKSYKNVNPKTGETLNYKEFYENGSTKRFSDYESGITTYLYPNGIKARIYNHKTGVTRTYYPDGVLKSINDRHSVKYYTKEGNLSKKVEFDGSYSEEIEYLNGGGRRFTFKRFDYDGNVSSVNVYDEITGVDKTTELKNGKIFKESEMLKDKSEKVRIFDGRNREVYSSTITPEMRAAHNRYMLNRARRTGEGVSSFTDGGMYVEHPTTTHSVLSHTIDKVVDNMKDKVKTVTQYFDKGIQQEKVYDIGGKKPKLTKLTLTRQDGTRKVTEFLPDGTKKVTELPAEVKTEA